MEKLPVTLKTSKLKIIILFLTSGLFVLTGFYLMKSIVLIAWFSIVFFGICCLVFSMHLFTNSPSLTINNEGLVIKSLFRTAKIPWEIIEEFGNGRQGIRAIVFINYNKNHKKNNLGKSIARSISGFDGSLPDTYGVNAKKLAQLLTNYKNLCNPDLQPNPFFL